MTQYHLAAHLVPIWIAHDLLKKYSKGPIADEDLAYAASVLDGRWKTENAAACMF